MQNLLAQAEKRKIEYERRNERIIQKEREAEGDEFRDKEEFVTSSYKKKLEEMKILDEEDMKLSMIEGINDVTKQRDMGSFYRHLYKNELCKENDDKIEEVKKTIKKSDANRQYRKRASSNSSNDNDKDTDISDSNSESSVDSTKRKKIENRNEKKFEEKDTINKSEQLEKKSLAIEKSIKNLEDRQSINDEPELKEKAEDEPRDKKIEESKPKEVLPKVNIWEKRTVGDIYEAARQRYFERKMKQINIQVRS